MRNSAIAGNLVRSAARIAPLVSVLTLWAGFARSSPVTYNLVDVAFSDGGVAIGSFTYDAALNAICDYHIDLSHSSFAPGSYYFDPGDSSVYGLTPSTVYFANFSLPYAPELLLMLGGPMGDSGNIPLQTSILTSSLDCWNGPCGVLRSGAITSNPEPDSVLLTFCAGGALILGTVLLRKFRGE